MGDEDEDAVLAALYVYYGISTSDLSPDEAYDALMERAHGEPGLPAEWRAGRQAEKHRERRRRQRGKLKRARVLADADYRRLVKKQGGW